VRIWLSGIAAGTAADRPIVSTPNH